MVFYFQKLVEDEFRKREEVRNILKFFVSYITNSLTNNEHQ